MPYVHFPHRPPALTAEFAGAHYDQLVRGIAAADRDPDAQSWLSLFEDWNALRSYVGSEGARLSFTYTRDMRNQAAEDAERIYREQVVPRAEDGEAQLVAALLASPHRGAVAERYGEQLLRVLEIKQAPLAPVNAALRVAVGELSTQYDKLVANGEVHVDGKPLTLARARGLTSSGDARVRREAFEAYHGWYLEHRPEITAIYAQQMQLRDQMGRNLGDSNFLPLGYAGMQRVDYGPPQAARFRHAVHSHVSPLFARLAARQARALGTATLQPWDAAYDPSVTLPAGVAEPISEQLDRAERMFARLSPRLVEHFRRMREDGLIDLENRPGKAAGAYCTAFPDEQRVAVFCNSVGDESDLRTLTHEMGHAFQGWESQWIESIELQDPSADAAEVHSMGMEFLCLPHIDEFLTSEHCSRYARGRWKRAVEVLCYVCAIDEFQHWAYENPSCRADDLDEAWASAHQKYLPGIDWSGEAARYRACRWYSQLHVFRYPFYYIDYGIAETGAAQLALLDARDHDACLETYLELCRLGGTGSVLELFQRAGLRSPFDDELMADLMRHAASVLLTD